MSASRKATVPATTAPTTATPGSDSIPAPTSTPAPDEQSPASSGQLLRTEPELCQPDGADGKTVTVPVPVGWTKSTRSDGCDWAAPDGMGSVSVSEVGEKQATFSAVREVAKDASGFVAGYREVALYGDGDSRFGETVVWQYLGEDVYTFHFASYYAAGWRTNLMLDEPRWDTTGAATFAQIRREFAPLP